MSLLPPEDAKHPQVGAFAGEDRGDSRRPDHHLEVVSPSASILVEAMRDIGYSLESAVADILDNSIAAGATAIDVRFGWDDRDQPWIAVLDNGRGMTPQELVAAMRLGTRHPRETRDARDLGRFGLGLKTASFSQCRRLAVIARIPGAPVSGRCWDLDLVGETDEWTLLSLPEEELSRLPCFDELGEGGTLVLWQKLDRHRLDGPLDKAQAVLNRQMSAVREHLALVFHRYLSGEPGLPKLAIRINRQPVEPFDPFNSGNRSTIYLPPEPFTVDGQRVEMHPYILPHHSKVKPEEYQKYAGSQGYLRSQGFYIYRNHRLIIYGTWFRMAPQEELTKLARVRIDIPNTLDHLWTIDVRKSRAHPPEVIRQRMRGLLDRIRENAKRPYTHRGSVIEKRGTEPIWRRREFNDKIRYEINPDHPLLFDLRSDLSDEARRRLDLLLQMIGQGFPTALFFSDMAGRPERSDQAAPEVGLLGKLAAEVRGHWPEEPFADFRNRLRGMEPFASHPDALEAVLQRMKEDV
jgi:hypothetical protein